MPDMNLQKMKSVTVENIESSATETGKSSGASECNSFKKSSKYQVNGKIFMVEPVFQECGNKTIGSILVKLMQTDAENT